jgi:sugar/nucleoside kinase (ribokinase family)
MLSGEPGLLGAARWVCEHGPRVCIVKKGEHGALMRAPHGTFVLPGFPHEEVVDPTGAGDSFAGGFMGHVAAEGDLSPATLKVALAYGTVAASFAIERFGLAGLEAATPAGVEERLAEFVAATHIRPAG